MTNNKKATDPVEEADFTGMHLSEIKNLFYSPGDEEEIVNEQEQNEVVNEEEEGKTTNANT